MAIKKLNPKLRYNLSVQSIDPPKQFPGPNSSPRYSYKMRLADQARNTYLAEFIWTEPSQQFFILGNHTPFEVFKEDPVHDIIVPVDVIMSEYEVQIINANAIPINGTVLQMVNNAAISLLQAEITAGLINKEIDDIMLSRYWYLFNGVETFIAGKLYEGVN